MIGRKLCAAVVLLTAFGVESAEDPPTSWDGLIEVKAKHMDAAFLLPGADFRPCGRVIVDPTQVAFKKEWLKDTNQRGGAGFPTGLKWELGRKARGDIKYIVCNADEGDPGAFMDRAVIEGNPHAVIEGMLIAAFAIGAHFGYVYIRAEYPLAVERLKLAIDKARRRHFLGNNIFGTTLTLI